MVSTQKGYEQLNGLKTFHDRIQEGEYARMSKYRSLFATYKICLRSSTIIMKMRSTINFIRIRAPTIYIFRGTWKYF